MLISTHPLLFVFFSFFYFLSSLNVSLAGDGANSVAGKNPFTAKASVIRYWKKQISNGLPKPEFLLEKASPLSAVQLATFTKLASENALSTQLPSFCSSANLLCFPDLAATVSKHDESVNFVSYMDKNFTNYGTDHLGGLDSFKNYSASENLPVDTFRRYSRDAVGNEDKFANYAPEANVADQSFSTYGTGTTGGSGEFKNYIDKANVPNLRFTSYSASTNGREQKFTAYSEESNAGDGSFKSYAKNGNGASNEFNSYGKDTNVLGSTFSSYGQNANGESDNFTSYGFNGNVPQNNFKNYGAQGNGAEETFTTYRQDSNVGDDSFTSYSKDANAEKVNFINYGKSFNEGTDKFKGYGTDGSTGHEIAFKTYGVNNTFKDYAKNGVKFSQYVNQTAGESTTMAKDGKTGNRWVEPGKFFREKILKGGNIIPMPDIRDKMPKRSFLPRVILSKLPFSTSKLGELKQIFHAGEDSTMAGMLSETLKECERAPAKDETKRCVGSMEDMIDFATTVLGRNVVVRTTDSTAGSKQEVMIGAVKGINGGRVTKAVSCHQSLFPYLVYYCHSVPKVRVYEADLLDPKSKAKINHGVAICHVDTSAWSPTHGAFVALGSGPGKIEVCHWIFENDMNWAQGC